MRARVLHNLSVVLPANFADLAFGIVLIYQTLLPESTFGDTATTIDLGYLYYLISPSFYIFLTLAIVVRLVELRRVVQNASGGSGLGGIDTTIVTLIEPCALYTVSFLLFVVPWGSRSFVADIFFPAFVQVQVRVPTPFSLEHSGLIAVTNR